MNPLFLIAALYVFPYQHPTGCPCRFLTGSDIANIPDSTMSQGVKVAVAGLLESSDRHVLLTRRAQHMRTFPCVWVPPGMHNVTCMCYYSLHTSQLAHQAGAISLNSPWRGC